MAEQQNRMSDAGTSEPSVSRTWIRSSSSARSPLPRELRSLLFIWIIVAGVELAIECGIAIGHLQALSKVPHSVHLFGRNLARVQTTYHAIFTCAVVLQLCILLFSVMQRNSMDLLVFLALGAGTLGYAGIQVTQDRRIWSNLPRSKFMGGLSLGLHISLIMASIAAFVVASILAVRLRKHFGWAIYRKMGASWDLRRALRWRFVVLAMIKLDAFFYLAFELQWLVIRSMATMTADNPLAPLRGASLWTHLIAALLCTLILCILSVWATHPPVPLHEYHQPAHQSARPSESERWPWALLFFTLGTLGILGYLSWVMFKANAPNRYPELLPVRRSLSFSVVCAMLSAVVTIIATIGSWVHWRWVVKARAARASNFATESMTHGDDMYPPLPAELETIKSDSKKTLQRQSALSDDSAIQASASSSSAGLVVPLSSPNPAAQIGMPIPTPSPASLYPQPSWRQQMPPQQQRGVLPSDSEFTEFVPTFNPISPSPYVAR